MRKNNNSYNKIYSVVKEIPYGKVATYGQIAALAGLGRNARLVGYALHSLPDNSGVPWHRVVNSQGKISFSINRRECDNLQQRLLEKEGVIFDQNAKINFEKYLWQPR